MNEDSEKKNVQTDGRLLRGEKRREAILATAVEVFGEQGFRGSSLRELSKRIGISEPGILHHFGSKAGLLAAVIAERDRLAAQQREEHEQAGMPFVDQLRAQVLQNSSSPGLTGLHVMIAAEATDESHPAHQMIIERYRALRHQDDEIFKTLQENSKLSDAIDPTTVGQIISAVMDGLQLQWLLDPENVHMPELFDQFLNLLQLDSAKK